MGRILALLCSLFVGAVFSQAPEFAQQYRQRIGGAIDELAAIVARFDVDAAREGLTRDAALERHRRSPDPFFARRGVAMGETIDRLGRLDAQLRDLTENSGFVRLLPLMRQIDGDVARRTLDVFEPALPLTLEGLGFAGFGMVSGWGAARLVGRLSRRRRVPAATSDVTDATSG